MNGFDRLAPIYDALVWIVFRKSMVNAQTFFLDRVKSGDHVLILGGGTGWLLSELLKKQPDCEVWYIESSPRMLNLAQEKNHNHPKVHFILGTQASIPEINYDVVIMNFFLDLFSEERITPLIMKIKSHTKSEGVWLVSDFEDEGKWWQALLLKVMISFFRLVCSIEATKLPDLRSILTKKGMIEIAERSFFRGFIRSGVYSESINLRH